MTYRLEPPIIAIVGATGTGKSALAIALARILEVVRSSKGS